MRWPEATHQHAAPSQTKGDSEPRGFRAFTHDLQLVGTLHPGVQRLVSYGRGHRAADTTLTRLWSVVFTNIFHDDFGEACRLVCSEGLLAQCVCGGCGPRGASARTRTRFSALAWTDRTRPVTGLCIRPG